MITFQQPLDDLQGGRVFITGIAGVDLTGILTKVLYTTDYTPIHLILDGDVYVPWLTVASIRGVRAGDVW